MGDIKTKTQGKWKSLLTLFGADSRSLDGKHHSCPLCPGDGGKDRFRFDDKEGKGTYFCSQCGAGDGFDFLMKLKGWEFKEAVREVEKIVGRAEREVAQAKPDAFKVKNWMQQIWNSGVPVERFNPVGKFWERRGILPDMYPSTVRYVEKCYYSKGIYHPAMVAIFQGPDGIAGQLHKTFLTYDGHKANVETVRKTMPLPFPDGGAVRLGGIPSNGALGIAEGMESAMAASQIFGVTTWAALTKVNLMKFQPPEEIEELFVFSDNDMNFAGQAHAYGLANRIAHKRPGKILQVCVPKIAGEDWNDELIKKVA